MEGATGVWAEGRQGIGGESQPLLYGVTRAYTRGFVSLRREGSLPEPRGGRKSRRMISLVHSYLWVFGGIISYPREP